MEYMRGVLDSFLAFWVNRVPARLYIPQKTSHADTKFRFGIMNQFILEFGLLQQFKLGF